MFLQWILLILTDIMLIPINDKVSAQPQLLGGTIENVIEFAVVSNPCPSCPLRGMCGDECGRNPSNYFRMPKVL